MVYCFCWHLPMDNDDPFSTRMCHTHCNGAHDPVWRSYISHNISAYHSMFCNRKATNSDGKSSQIVWFNYRLVIGRSLATTSSIRRCVSWLSARANFSVSLDGIRNCDTTKFINQVKWRLVIRTRINKKNGKIALTFDGTRPIAVNTVCQYDQTNIINTIW